jgi:hypothetical protein
MTVWRIANGTPSFHRRLYRTFPDVAAPSVQAYLRDMTRDAALAAVAQFLATRGATRCQPAFVCGASGALPPQQEAARIANMRVKESSMTRRQVSQAPWRSLFRSAR